MKTKILTRQALIASIYFVVTYLLKDISYGPVQFRVAEILNILAFYNPVYIIGVTAGCFIANLYSQFGVYDLIFGTLHTFISLTAMSKIKNVYVASLMPSLFSFIVGIGIMLATGTTAGFFITTAQIMLSEFVAVSLISVPLFKVFEKNSYIRGNILYIPFL